jgi:type IV secretion system protein VirD4
MIRGLWAVLIRLVLVAAFVIFAASAIAFSVWFQGLAVLVGAAVVWRSLTRWRASGAYGTARLANMGELLRAGMLGERGLLLGRVGYCTPPGRLLAWRFLLAPALNSQLACRLFFAAFYKARWVSGCIIRIQSYVHLSTFAPAGSGKSVSVLLPNLLGYSGPCVVVDPKGELFKATAEHRRRRFGHKVVRLDPYGVCGPGADAYNALDLMEDGDADLVEQCRDLANQLVVRQADEREPYWNDQAENVIATFLYFIALCEDRPEDRNLETLRNLLSSPLKYGTAIQRMQADPEDEILNRLGDLTDWIKDKELNGIMSSVQRHTQWMDTRNVAACMARSTFDPRMLRSGRATIYLILPENKLTVMQPLLRLWIGSMLRMLTKRGADESNPVLFLVDEAGHLGNMKALEDAVTLLRGMGIRLWFFWQSLDQVKKCFGERANILLGNMHTQQYFGINDYETAEALSKRIGEATVRVTSHNRTRSRSWGNGMGQSTTSDSTSITTSEIARRLLRPEEILTLNESVCLLFHKNLHVIPATLLHHFADREFKGGGTGRSRGLGLAALPVAAFTLAFSVFFAAFIGGLSVPVRRQAVYRPGYPATAYRAAMAGGGNGVPPGEWNLTVGGVDLRSWLTKLNPWKSGGKQPTVYGRDALSRGYPAVPSRLGSQRGRMRRQRTDFSRLIPIR